jgi:hypothetical protein
MYDMFDKKLEVGHIIDIHQTVNGQNKFVIFSLSPLDIRYYYNLSRKYEYDKKDLLKPDKYTGEVEWEIIGLVKSCKGLI